MVKASSLNAMKNESWGGAKIQTDGVPMVDAGVGKPLILRTFEFAINQSKVQELKEKGIVVTQQEIFNTHWPQIRKIIWSDGLVASTDVDPRIVIGKKRYRIFILCEPKFRTLIAEKPKTLQEVFKARQTKK